MFSFMNTQDITNALRDVWYESYRTSPIVQAHDDRLPSLSLVNGPIIRYTTQIN